MQDFWTSFAEEFIQTAASLNTKSALFS